LQINRLFTYIHTYIHTWKRSKKHKFRPRIQNIFTHKKFFYLDCVVKIFDIRKKILKSGLFFLLYSTFLDVLHETEKKNKKRKRERKKIKK
jgi:hypothetical protein